jgi:hypothetical protein
VAHSSGTANAFLFYLIDLARIDLTDTQAADHAFACVAAATSLPTGGSNSPWPGRGRFRSLLLKSLQNFLADDAIRKRAHKRGGEIEFVSWDEWMAEAPSKLSVSALEINFVSFIGFISMNLVTVFIVSSFHHPSPKFFGRSLEKNEKIFRRRVDYLHSGWQRWGSDEVRKCCGRS